MIGVGLIALIDGLAAIGPTSQFLVVGGKPYPGPWFWPLSPLPPVIG